MRGKLTLVVITGLLSVSLSSATSAGTYNVVACDAAAAYGHENNSWMSSNTDPLTSSQVGSTGSNCQSSGAGSYSGLGSYDIIGSGAWSAANSAWTFTAPSGTTITNTAINRYIGKYLEPDWRPYGKFDGVIQDTCDYSSGFECSNSGTFSGDYGDSTIAYGYSCDDGGGCAIGATRHAVYAFLHSATITLSESVDPSLTITSSDFQDSGNLTDTQTVSFQGNDARGIKKAELYIDNSLKNTATNTICDYTYVNPCADPEGANESFTSSLSYDTTQLPDGTHTAYVRIYDAADNTTDSDIWSFMTDNIPNTGSGTGSETGGGSGSGGTTGGGSGSEMGGGSGTDTGTGTSAGSDTNSGGTTTDSSSGSTAADGGSTDSTATKSSTNLKIKSARLKNGRLTVKGTCTRHNYSKRFRLSYDPARGEIVRKRFKCTKGRWSVTLALGRRAGQGRLTVSYPGDKRIAKKSVSRLVRK